MCHLRVTGMSPAFHRCFTVVPVCRWHVTGMSAACQRRVSGVSPACHRRVTCVSPACPWHVTCVSPVCHRCVGGVSPPCHRRVGGVSPVCQRRAGVAGIVLSWNMEVDASHAAVSNYQLYAYQEGALPASAALWKKVRVQAQPVDDLQALQCARV